MLRITGTVNHAKGIPGARVTYELVAGNAVTDPDADARRLAAEPDDPTAWFEDLYVAADRGAATVPWDRGEPQQLLTAWVERAAITGNGRRALVVGCGLGRDAEYLAGLGFDTVAFDVAETAVRVARSRHPGSPVHYVVADLLDPPEEWHAAFDLVVESMNVQALPSPVREDAIARVGGLVRPGGTLLVIAFASDDTLAEGPPWPLSRADIDAFGTGGLAAVHVELLGDDDDPPVYRWRAEFSS